MTLSPVLHFLALVASVVSAAGSLVLHESRPAVPHGFIYEGAVLGSDQITLRVALASKNISGLQDTLMSISTPGNAAFRQWLSADEIKSYVEPSSTTLAAFKTFTTANGLSATSISPHGDWVSLTLPVSQANTLFGAQYAKYSHPSLDQPITRTLAISLPSELVGHVDAIDPSTAFLVPRNPRAAPSVSTSFDKRGGPAASCNTSDPAGETTPSCLQELYGIPSTPASHRQDNRLLVTGYDGRSPSNESLSEFLADFRPDVSSDTGFSLIKLDNATFSRNASSFDLLLLEADLDIQYTVGVATGIPVEFLSVGGDDSDPDDSGFITAFLDTISFLGGLDNPPSVMTTSYAFNEVDIGPASAKKLCDGYSTLGARGISVLFSSGDGGVRGNHDNLTECDSTAFIPTFPSSCPWVTTVGSTQGFEPETAVNFTSGGFSNFFPRPSYQRTAVQSFLATLPKDFPREFNRSGRGYPDVSVQGNNFAFISQGVHFKTGGTSLSSPTFASVIALVNDQLLSAGKPRLGFLNPWLYEHESTFTDITAGRNPGDLCPSSSVAFEAVKGWDPLTGVGTPVFSKLLRAAFASHVPFA